MEPHDLLDLEERLHRLEEENRTLRAALAPEERGRLLLRQKEEFSRLLSVATLIVSELDATRVCDLVAAHTRELVEAELVLVPMLDEERQHYTYVAASGVSAETVIGQRFSASVGMCGWVLRNERSLLFGEKSTTVGDALTRWEHGQQSAVLVPLFGRRRIIGGLSALGKIGGGCFTQHDLELMTMFASQVSIAIENAQLFQQLSSEITVRVGAEEALRKSEERLSTILDTVDEGFIVVDRDFRIAVANRAFCDQAGKPASEVLGRHCYEVSHGILRPCHAEGIECAVTQVFDTGEPASTSHTHADAEGAVFHVETKAYPLRDPSGQVVSAIETLTNVTERHLLAQERLKTQKLESIGILAGGIAHDFNNLLHGIFGNLSLAKEFAGERERSLEMLEQAEQALDLAVALTTQLLTFSKGGAPLKKPLALGPLVENAARFSLSGSTSTYRLEIAPDLWLLEADAGQLGQVVQNIVLNAAQAMPGGGTVTIRAENVTLAHREQPPLGAGPHVRLSIQDQGCGIPEDCIHRIFEPYFTLKEHGSGLGLATSYSVIKAHTGHIGVASKEGEGSTFTVLLPALGPGEVADPAPPAPAKARKARILVMDDEELVLRVTVRMLRTLGHEVEVANRGERAIDLYQRALREGSAFDAVILDLTVPGGLGGRETLEQLLQIDPGVRAIVSSGYSEDAAMAEYREIGFQGRLKKPYLIADLRLALSSLLRA